MNAMSVLDWVVVGLAVGIALGVLGLVAMVVIGCFDSVRDTRGADAWDRYGEPHEDDGCDDVPFPEAIRHERPRCVGCVDQRPAISHQPSGKTTSARDGEGRGA